MATLKQKTADENIKRTLEHRDIEEEDRKRKLNDQDDDEESDENEDEPQPVINKFANDGSFLEMFKKMQQQQQEEKNKQKDQPIENETKSDSNNEKTKRKPKVLKTGIIEKSRMPSNSDNFNDDNSKNGSMKNGSNAWNRYMNEVRAYKQKYGDDEDKNRPLVK